MIPNDPEQNADHMFECAERQEEKKYSEASKNYECAMCKEKVLDKGKRFGILSTKFDFVRFDSSNLCASCRRCFFASIELPHSPFIEIF